MLRSMFVTSALFLSACSLVIDTKDKCATDADCLNGWTCMQGRCVTTSATGGGVELSGSGGGSSSAGGSATGGSSASGGGVAGSSEVGTIDPKMTRGAVQKGPFVLGATIEAGSVSRLDGTVAPLGKSSYTKNDLGAFELDLPLGSLVQLTATGDYFNESTREQSKGAITLHAIVEIPSSGGATAFINVVTEMSHRRIRKFIATGETASEAIRKAELELKHALGFTDSISLVKATEMNVLGADSISNSYLLNVTCILAHAAHMKTPQSPDTELKNLLNAIAFDLENDGALESNLTTTIASGRATLDPVLCAEGLKNYAKSYDAGVQVASILRTFDFDKDGTFDDQDSDADGDGYSSSGDVPMLIAERRYNEPLIADKSGQLWWWPENQGPKLVGSFGTAFSPNALVASPMQSILMMSNGNLWRLGLGEQAVPDSRLTMVTSIAPGGCSSSGDILAVKGDGTVWNLAENGTGVTQLANFSDVWMIAGDPAHGGGHAVIKKDYSLWTAKTGPSATLDRVPGLDSLVSVVGGGWYCNGFLALKTDGTAWTWTWDSQNAVVAKKVMENVASIFSVIEVKVSMRLISKDGSVWKLPSDGSAPIRDTELNQAVQIGSHTNVVLLPSDGLLRKSGPTTSHYEPMYLPR